MSFMDCSRSVRVPSLTKSEAMWLYSAISPRYGSRPVVGQSEPSSTELLLENAVLFTEIVDHRVLLTAYAASEGSDENLPGLQNDGHP